MNSSTDKRDSLLRRFLSRDVHLWLALALLAVHMAYYFGWSLDDPYISYRYAQNVAAGEGFVFNVGERVEGYSNFTYVCMLAVAAKVGIDLPTFSSGFGFVCSLLALLVVWKATRESDDPAASFSGWGIALSDGAVSRVGVYLLAISGPFAMWGVGGLETPFHALIGTAAIWLCAREIEGRAGLIPWSALLCALAAMSRPEGVIFAAVCVIAMALFLARGRGRMTWRRFAVWGATFVVVFGAYNVWRVAYFGEWLPNTYHAKATGALGDRLADGGRYALGVIALMGSLLAVVVIGVASVRLLRFSALTTLALGVVLAHLAFLIWAGGDWMPMGRFMAPAIPAYAWLAQDVIRWLSHRDTGSARTIRRLGVAFTVIVCVGAGLVCERLASFDYVYALRTDSLHQQYVEAGKWLKDYAEPDDWLASEEAGIVPYYSELPFIDMLGLVDKHIAHMDGGLFQKYDARYVLERAPRFVFLQCVWPPEEGARYEGHDPGGRELLALDEFHARYRVLKTWTRGNDRRSNPMVLFERINN